MKQEPGLTWISTEPGVCPVLHQLQQHSIFSDVSLLDDAGVSVQAHACILAAGSPVLRNTLMLKQSRALLRKQGVTLRIGGVTNDIWNIIVQFLYLNKVEMDGDLNLIHSVHRVAKMLGIKSLENLILEQVENLALQIVLTSETGAVNVTVAPTLARQHQHRYTQTDKSEEQGSSSVADALSKPNNFNFTTSKALALGGSQSVLKMIQLSQNSGDVLQSPPSKRLKVVNLEPNHVTETLQTSEFSTYQLEKDAVNEASSEEVVQEGCEEVGLPLEPVQAQTHKQGRGRLACRYCSMLFDKRIALIDHLVEACPKVFKDRKIFNSTDAMMSCGEESGSPSLLQHIKRERVDEDGHGSSNYHCINEECSASFSSHASFMTHLTECVMEGNFINPRLNVTLTAEDSLVYDDGIENIGNDAIEKPTATLTEVNSNVKIYTCTHCKVRGVKERMAVHLAVVHGKRKPYCCKKCFAKYGYFESFRDHYISNHTSQTFPCEELGCNAVFNKKDALRRHNLMDHKREGKEMHECRGCHKMFKYAHHARRHEKYHMGKEEREHTCGTCHKAFVTRQDLERHKDIHTGCKPYKCSQCFYTTSRKSNLILHERKHGVVHGDFVCTTCMKYFISETRFKSHLNSLKHEGCRVDELPSHVVTYPTDDSERVVYQEAVEFDGTNTTPLTVERVANPSNELQVVPIDSLANDPALAQGVAALGNNNLVYVVASGDDYVLNVVDSQAVLNT